MSSITEYERWLHPTTADIYGILDCDHCDFCEGQATGLQAWWCDPNTVQGKEQLDALGEHIMEQYGVLDEEDPEPPDNHMPVDPFYLLGGWLGARICTNHYDITKESP